MTTNLTFKWDGNEGSMVSSDPIVQMSRIAALDFLDDIIFEASSLYALLMADGGVFPGTEVSQ